MTDISGYRYSDAELNVSHDYLLPAVMEILSGTRSHCNGPPTLFDLGCGNGSVTSVVADSGIKVRGVDVSIDGIEQANRRFPHLDLKVGSAYENLREQFGTFHFVLSLEVVEHLYNPRLYAKNVYNLLNEGGYAIISTPYHGYVKNVALAVSGKLDNHFTALWDHGHIKFWSIKTLGKLLEEAGFRSIEFRRVGRIPILAKSVIAIARK